MAFAFYENYLGAGHGGEAFPSLARTTTPRPRARGPGRIVYDYVRANADLAQADPAGAPVLYVRGMLDTIMPPAREAACNLLLLRRSGVDVEACTDDAALHGYRRINAAPSRHRCARVYREPIEQGRSAAGSCRSLAVARVTC